MTLGIAQLAYGLLTILYLKAIQRNYPLLAGRQLYVRLSELISERGAAWLLRGIAIALIVGGMAQLMK